MGNDEKIIGLLEQLTIDVSDLKQGQEKLDLGQAKLENDVFEVKSSLTKIEETVQTMHSDIVLLELEQSKKIDSALDGFRSNRMSIEEHDKRINILEKVSIKHSMEFELLKSG
jgi:hypothetical protein